MNSVAGSPSDFLFLKMIVQKHRTIPEEVFYPTIPNMYIAKNLCYNPIKLLFFQKISFCSQTIEHYLRYTQKEERISALGLAQELWNWK